jgi:hypothetical protein
MSKTKTIKVDTIFGDPRMYKFKLMDAETGIKIFYRFSTVIAASYEVIKPVLNKLSTRFFDEQADEDQRDNTNETDNTLTLADLFRLLPQVFTWDTLIELSKEMLTGAVVTVGDDEHTIGDNGICHWSAGDPMEQFQALFYATCANYPKYVAFFGVALDDSNQPSEGSPAAATK